MIRYGNPEEVIEYFADGSANQSYLKQLIKGVEHLEEKEEVLYFKEKGHFLFGSAVDVWITQGKANYDKQYYESGGKKPSDSIMSMVRMVFDSLLNANQEVPGEHLIDVNSGYIVAALDYHKYQSRWKPETRINKVVEEGALYFEELKESHGKTILSAEESNVVWKIVMSLQTHKYTERFFKDDKNMDIFYQVPIYFMTSDVPCKALLDMVIVNHTEKKVFPIDIKTLGGFTSEFPWSVKSRGYNFQAAFYTEALLELKERMARTIKGFPDISEYQIMPFKFIVETTKTWKNVLTDVVTYYQGKPLVYELSRAQMRLGRDGRPAYTTTGRTLFETIRIEHKEIVGFKKALNLHKWHMDNGFEEDKEVIENQGVILVK